MHSYAESDPSQFGYSSHDSDDRLADLTWYEYYSSKLRQLFNTANFFSGVHVATASVMSTSGECVCYKEKSRIKELI